jgi:hypothetical protein
VKSFLDNMYMHIASVDLQACRLKRIQYISCIVSAKNPHTVAAFGILKKRLAHRECEIIV